MKNEELTRSLTQAAKDMLPGNFDEYQGKFSEACFSLANDVLRKFGILQKAGDRETFQTIKEKIGLPEQAEYIMNQLLKILIEDRMLVQEGDDYICVAAKETPGPMESMISLLRSYPDEGASIQWVARAFDGMYDLFTNNTYPEDILFPWGSFDLVEDVYNNSPLYSYYSRLAGAAIAELKKNFFTNSPVSLLEVGAGTGNGTRNILEYNPGIFESYVYTDISRSLVKKSKKQFTADFFEFKMLDISKDPLEQSFENGIFEITAAVNVLHAAPDVKKALTHIRELLKPGGWIVLAEVSPPKKSIYRYMELTFGLLPSYNTYEDKQIRPMAPILRPEEWTGLLEELGFCCVDAFPCNKLDIDDRGGIIIGKKE